MTRLMTDEEVSSISTLRKEAFEAFLGWDTHIARQTPRARADKRHRPLSQTGLDRYRIPKNPRQRLIDPETGLPCKRRAIDARNERLAAEKKPRRLHPTKGFRDLSARQSEAERLTDLLRRGVGYTIRQIATRLRSLR